MTNKNGGPETNRELFWQLFYSFALAIFVCSFYIRILTIADDNDYTKEIKNEKIIISKCY